MHNTLLLNYAQRLHSYWFVKLILLNFKAVFEQTAFLKLEKSILKLL
jgi:hypothetical protein